MKKTDESMDAQGAPLRPTQLKRAEEAATEAEEAEASEAAEGPRRGVEETLQEVSPAPLLPEIRIVDARDDAEDVLPAPDAVQESVPPRPVDPGRFTPPEPSEPQVRRPWVDVHPRVPRALKVSAIVLVVAVAGFFILSKHIDPSARDQRILTLMDAQAPELNRHADPLPEIADELTRQGENAEESENSKDSKNSSGDTSGEPAGADNVQAAEDPAAMGLDQAAFSAGDAREPLPATEEDALRCLIIKVEDGYIRANGKLVTLVDLDKICRGLSDDCHTLKLINRHGDATVVEHVVSLLNQLDLSYQFVKN